MNNEKTYEKIQAYLHGELTDQELLSFENELDTDPNLKDELDLHLVADDAIELLVEDSLREELMSLHTTKNTAQSGGGGRLVKMRRLTLAWAAAASVLLLIGFFAPQYMGDQYSNEAIASHYYGQSGLSNLRTSRGVNSDALLKTGLDLIANGQYQEAVDYFNTVQDSDITTDVNYYKGHALYMLEEYNKAMPLFDNVARTDDPRFKEKAELYYLLTAIAANDIEGQRFDSLLKKILADNGHIGHNLAKSIDKDLNSFWRKF